MSLANVCVYCGSGDGADARYLHDARALGKALAHRGIGLVYGGAHLGLMGAVADAALSAGGRVVGVIPAFLVEREAAHPGVSELVVTASMHARKVEMAARADAFVTLAGGLGTLEELFEIWTWAQLGLHDKPLMLINTAGYFDGLLTFLDHAVAQGFVRPPHRARLWVASSPERALDVLQG